MIKACYFDTQKDWDDAIHLLLLAAREVAQECLGFSSFELGFGHTVHIPLRVAKEGG